MAMMMRAVACVRHTARVGRASAGFGPQWLPAVSSSAAQTNTIPSSRWMSSSSEDEEKRREREIEALQSRNVDRSLLRKLPFDDYVRLRRKLTIRSYLFGVPCFFTGIMGSAYVCATYLPNPLPETPEEVELVMGVDPMLFSTVATTVSGFASFFIGAAVFRTLWRSFFREHAAMLDARETDFRLRVARHRRGGHEFSHDYYGDKVKTLSDYKAWLSDQRKAEKKLKGII